MSDGWDLFDASSDDDDASTPQAPSKPVTVPVSAALSAPLAQQRAFADLREGQARCPTANAVRQHADRLRLNARTPPARKPQNEGAHELLHQADAWPAPREMGPVKLLHRAPAKGGRGFAATRSIPAGTVLCSEVPLFAWPSSESGEALHVAGARALIRHAEYARLAPMVRQLHPRSLGDISPDMVKHCKGNHGDDIKDILALPDAQGKGLTKDDIVLLLLQFQCNGFSSGLYLHLCIFNHSCTPNAIKLKPTAGSDTPSIVRALRDIEPGEELTISYLDPVEATTAARQVALSQFGFACQCQLCSAEFWDGWQAAATAAAAVTAKEENNPAKEADAAPCRAENVSVITGLCRVCHPTELSDEEVAQRIAEIEAEMREYRGPPPPRTKAQRKKERQRRNRKARLQKQQQQQQQQQEKDKSATVEEEDKLDMPSMEEGGDAASTAQQDDIATEAAVREAEEEAMANLPPEVRNATHLLDFATSWLADAVAVVHPMHILVARIHRLVIKACADLLKTHIPSEAFVEIGCQMLRSSLALHQYLQLTCSPHHPDRGQALYDVTSLLGSVAAQDRDALLRAFPQWANAQELGAFERAAYQEHARIKKLFKMDDE